MISFGPIPSRRLGRSLGINNIPLPKVCSYSCVYCQLGTTRKHCVQRKKFFEPQLILRETEKLLSRLKEQHKPDYLTFVANGEPTLDLRLGESIRLLKMLNIPVAVITNASLLGLRQVRDDLHNADWVSVKIDTADQVVWKDLNRPHADIDFRFCLHGLSEFAREYQGRLVTETMLVKGVNDQDMMLKNTARLVTLVDPVTAYLSVPTRPPALCTVDIPSEETLVKAYQVFTDHGLKTEMLLGFEGTDTGFTGNAAEDILNICAVHPIREDTLRELLEKDHADMAVIEELIREQKIRPLEYKSKKFYLRKLK